MFHVKHGVSTMDGMDQLYIINDEYTLGLLMPQDYKHNLIALLKSFTEAELKAFSIVITLGEDAIKSGGN
jgi:hypothetical protein